MTCSLMAINSQRSTSWPESVQLHSWMRISILFISFIKSMRGSNLLMFGRLVRIDLMPSGNESTLPEMVQWVASLGKHFQCHLPMQ